MNHDGWLSTLERPLARRMAGRDACVLLAPCSWGRLAGREKGGGVDFWQCESSRAPHARIYTRMRERRVFGRGTARALLYPSTRSAGPISGMGCDARSTRCKVVGTAAGIEKGERSRTDLHPLPLGERIAGSLGCYCCCSLQCCQVHLSRGSGAWAWGPRLSSSSSCLGLAFSCCSL